MSDIANLKGPGFGTKVWNRYGTGPKQKFKVGNETEVWNQLWNHATKQKLAASTKKSIAHSNLTVKRRREHIAKQQQRWNSDAIKRIARKVDGSYETGM